MRLQDQQCCAPSLSIAREVGVELTRDDFDRLSETIPVNNQYTYRKSDGHRPYNEGSPAVMGEMKDFLNRRL